MLKKLFKHSDSFIDREFDNIVRNAQSKNFEISNVLPNDMEGTDGEIRIYSPSANNVMLLIKIRGHWYKINLNNLIEP